MGARDDERKETFMSLLSSANIVSPPCPHVAEGCGGCLLQSYRYEDQVRAKELYLARIYGKPVRVHPASDPLGYRSRMDYVCAFGKLGLRKRAKYSQVVDVHDCMLLPDFARIVYREAREFLLASGLELYDYLLHTGFLRYLVIRVSRTTRQIMLIITTSTPNGGDEHKRVQDILEGLFALSQAHGVRSLHWTVIDGTADTSVGKPYWHCGDETIIDEMMQSRFFITPQTFFQGNPAMAGMLFDRAMRFVKGDVLDLYCGVGVLAIFAAQEEDVGAVVGVEMNVYSIGLARENMRLNEVTLDKCEFVCADAAAYLANTSKHFTTIICDPARAGLGADACSRLLAHAPEHIIYISCNPLTHVEDLARLSVMYDVHELEGYDLFAQTPHLEVLSVLVKRS